MLKALRKRLASMKGDERGFTLVELLVVITIVGILAGVGVSGFRNFQERANATAADAAWRDLQVAINLFEIEGGTFPRGDESQTGDPNAVEAIATQLIPPPDPLKTNLWVVGVGGDPSGIADDPDTGFVVGGSGATAFSCVWVKGVPSRFNGPDCI